MFMRKYIWHRKLSCRGLTTCTVMLLLQASTTRRAEEVESGAMRRAERAGGEVAWPAAEVLCGWVSESTDGLLMLRPRRARVAPRFTFSDAY